MRIKKVNQTVATVGQIVNEASDSTVDTYSCDYIDDHKLDKFGSIQNFTPTMNHCTVTYTTRNGYYKKLDENTIIGHIVFKGKITAVDNPAYAEISVEIPNFNFDPWKSFAVMQEGKGLSSTPFAAICRDGNLITFVSQSSGGTGACSWETTDSLYIRIGFVLIRLQS